MRPLALSMSAFGPFAGTETIDFRTLGTNPLFLINGPTGSGKTTVLDAICFALYGETTGAEREASQMRCHHAGGETLTEVSFLFELGGIRFRIRRVPEQERPKKSGEGTTRQSPEAQLWRIRDDGAEEVLVPRRVSEATVRITELTGLSAEQFRQVMVLPQGKFRELLLAPSEQREKIFEQLFQTQIYAQLEQKLRGRANATVAELGRLRDLQRGALQGAGVDSADALVERLASLSCRIEAADVARQAADQTHRAAEGALAHARQTEQVFTDWDTARAELARLRGQADAQARDQARLAAGTAARAISPAYEVFVTRLREEAQSRDAERAAKEGLVRAEENETDCERAWQDVERRRPELDELKLRRSRLADLLDVAASLAVAEEDLQRAIRAREQAMVALADASRKRSETHERVAALNADILAARREIDGLGDAQAELARATERRGQRRRLDQAEDERRGDQRRLEIATIALGGAMQQLERAGQVYRALQQGWTAGQAAVLAQTLEAGAPCPVCGSTEHPAPARAEGTVPEEAELENARVDEAEARERCEALRLERVALESNLRAHEKTIDELRTALGHYADVDGAQLEALVAQLETDTARLVAARAALANTEAVHEELSARLPALDGAVQSTGAALERASREAAATEATVQQMKGRVPEELQAQGALEAALAQLEEESTTLDKRLREVTAARDAARETATTARADLAAAGKAAERASGLREAAEEKWLRALAGSEFGSSEAFREALLDVAALEALARSVRGYQDALMLADKAVAACESKLADTVRPDLDALRRAADETRSNLKRTTEEAATLRAEQQNLQNLFRSLEDLDRQQREREAEYAVVGRLHRISSGDNPHRVSLQRFVLSALLDDVLLHAGERLRMMSKGRYVLRRREDVADRRGKAGLDLDVEDAYTGRARPVATLSGGESFMAALAMALGLSDVVQAYSGGIRLDTLFVDEGFGSLDPEALDLAIRTLIDLQAQGRTVGIISHVPELKQQVGIQVLVDSSPTGSGIRLVVT